eukprot:12217063-Alexandrium_andersonii.AAC.1
MPRMDPPEQERQPPWAPPENALHDAAGEQNESDFSEVIFVTATGERWRTMKGRGGLAKARVQPRPLTAC